MVVPPKDEFPQRFKKLERRADAAFTAGSTRVGYTTIKDGGMRVIDDTDAVQIILGKQADGTYDLSILDEASGILLPSKQLLAPPVASAEDDIAMDGTTYAINEWITSQGPSVDCRVYTGSMLVTVSANLVASGTTPVDVYATIAVSGPSASTAADNQNSGLAIRFDASSGQSAKQQSSREIALTGLVPGYYTVSMAYYTGSIGTPAGSGMASHRGLIVRAY